MLLNRCLCCLNILDKNHSRLVDATLLEILEVLFEKSNVKVEISSRICYACEEKLKIAFKFKGLCIYTEDRLHPYIPGYVQNNKKIDLKEIYAKENQCNEPNTGYICRLCLQLVDECDKHLLLNVLEEENVKDTFKIYLPEVNLNSTEDPTICEPCRQSLINFLEFIGSSRPINNAVKVEPAENFQELYIKLEPLDIVSVKEENDSEIREKQAVFKKKKKLSGSELYRCPKEYMQCKSSVESHKQIDNGKILKSTLPSKNKRRKRCNLLSHSKRLIYKCDICSLETVSRVYLRIHKKAKHLQISQEKIYRCSVCSYEIYGIDSFKRHMLIHKNNSEVQLYICYDCGAKYKYKYILREHIQKYHMAMEQDESEIIIHKCSKCSYENKNIKLLNHHIRRIHIKVPNHTCKQCDFKTRYSSIFANHVRIIHNDGADVQLYHCQICSFNSAYRTNVARHMVVHMNEDEVLLHICKICNYKCQFPYILKRHMVIHTNEAQVKLHTCKICGYRCNYPYLLKRHMMVHVNLRNCKICDYKCRSPYQLKKHTQLHHNSNINIPKCELCTFSTKNRWHMCEHMKRLEDISEVHTYQCAKCSYKTIDRSSLKMHMLVHKSTSEVEMYKCSDCSYQTKYKNCLQGHKIIHTDTCLKCDQCEYETKHKSSLKIHQSRKHGDATNKN